MSLLIQPHIEVIRYELAKDSLVITTAGKVEIDLSE